MPDSPVLEDILKKTAVLQNVHKVGGQSGQTVCSACKTGVDKAAAKGILHKNNAAHKKSAMTLKLNQVG